MLLDDFKINKIIRLPIFIATILFIIIISIYSIVLGWKIECSNSDQLITIEKGVSANSVSKLLVKESCIQNESLFKLGLAITMNNTRLRAGRYNFKGISTIGQLINMLTSQSNERIKVTLIEGWSINQYGKELVKKLDININKFLRLCNDKDFVSSLDINAPSLEGFLYPDTYILLKTYTEEDIIKILVSQFKFQINKIKFNKSENYNLLEIATMASIIQGEAMYIDEMPIISSVYHNRLKKGMLLQADPTIQYIVPGKPRRLYNKHLKIDSPYNTYKYKGLPPGPINNPGIDAIKAAIYPAETKYLYFVSDLEGRHTFTYNSEQHNEAKRLMKKKRLKLKNK